MTVASGQGQDKVSVEGQDGMVTAPIQATARKPQSRPEVARTSAASDYRMVLQNPRAMAGDLRSCSTG
ncbi:MAG TPA: hypothetical protein VGV87_18050, partial [Blastocatellia bacterium]|nr:hypothetical protein [Blastocatellia bacterium]